MSADLSNRGPKDRARVNVNEAWELSFWCKKFNCTEIQLCATAKAFGPMVTDLQKHLRKSTKSFTCLRIIWRSLEIS